MKKLFIFIFFLALGFSLMSQTPSITVISPNGGEVWTIGSTHNITWHYTNLAGTVRIQLIRANSMTTVTTIINETPIETGSYSWTIPSTIQPNIDYRIAITWVSVLTVYFGDVSDNNFTISSTSPIPTLRVLSPNGGENWVVGSTHPITWTSTNLAGNVKILLVRLNSTTPSIIIASSVPVLGGVFNWNIPTTIVPASDYRVMITTLPSTTDPVYTSISDYSDNVFTISGGSTVPSLRVLTPNGGENWAIGSTNNITWTYSNLAGNVAIFLMRGSINAVNTTSMILIANNVPISARSYSWTIPATIRPAHNYKVRIVSMSPSTTILPIFDQSDNYFSIFSLIGITITSDPGKSGSTLNVETSSPTTVSVRIYNIRGQCIRTLVEHKVISGRESIVWDGRDQFNKKVTSGMYFVNVASDHSQFTKRLMLK
jgi:hypothetical protein